MKLNSRTASKVLSLLASPLVACQPNSDNQCSKKVQEAAYRGDIPRLSKSLDRDESIDCLGEWDQTLLVKTILGGHTEAAVFLIEKGAKPSSKRRWHRAPM